MAKARSKKTSDTETKLIKLVASVGGGLAGNQATSFMEKQTFLGEFAPHSAGITAVIGGLIYVLTPDNNDKMMQALSSFGLGMAVIGGVEESETLISMAKGALGYTPEELGLGFTPKTTPEMWMGDSINVNGIPVR